METFAPTAEIIQEMHQFHVEVRHPFIYIVHIIDGVSLHLLLISECPDSMFECVTGRVDGHNPPCISTEQRCDNITDCLGGEDEMEYSCPCEPEGAIRLVGGSTSQEGRVEFCRKCATI